MQVRYAPNQSSRVILNRQTNSETATQFRRLMRSTLLRPQVAHDNKEWEQQGVLSNADLSHAEYGDLVIDWEKLDYASARTARQIANIAYTLVVRLCPCLGFASRHGRDLTPANCYSWRVPRSMGTRSAQ